MALVLSGECSGYIWSTIDVALIRSNIGAIAPILSAPSSAINPGAPVFNAISFAVASPPLK